MIVNLAGASRQIHLASVSPLSLSVDDLFKLELQKFLQLLGNVHYY